MTACLKYQDLEFGSGKWLWIKEKVKATQNFRCQIERVSWNVWYDEKGHLDVCANSEVDNEWLVFLNVSTKKTNLSCKCSRECGGCLQCVNQRLWRLLQCCHGSFVRTKPRLFTWFIQEDQPSLVAHFNTSLWNPLLTGWVFWSGLTSSFMNPLQWCNGEYCPYLPIYMHPRPGDLFYTPYQPRGTLP